MKEIFIVEIGADYEFGMVYDISPSLEGAVKIAIDYSKVEFFLPDMTCHVPGQRARWYLMDTTTDGKLVITNSYVEISKWVV